MGVNAYITTSERIPIGIQYAQKLYYTLRLYEYVCGGHRFPHGMLTLNTHPRLYVQTAGAVHARAVHVSCNGEELNPTSSQEAVAVAVAGATGSYLQEVVKNAGASHFCRLRQ